MTTCGDAAAKLASQASTSSFAQWGSKSAYFLGLGEDEMDMQNA